MEKTNKKTETDKAQSVKKSLSSNPIENIIDRIEEALPNVSGNKNNPYRTETSTPVEIQKPVKRNP